MTDKAGRAGYSLPETGDGLISMSTVAQILSVHETTAWGWQKDDPNFPPLIRKGARFTRVSIAAMRAYLATLSAQAAPAKRIKKGAV